MIASIRFVTTALSGGALWLGCTGGLLGQPSISAGAPRPVLALDHAAPHQRATPLKLSVAWTGQRAGPAGAQYRFCAQLEFAALPSCTGPFEPFPHAPPGTWWCGGIGEPTGMSCSGAFSSETSWTYVPQYVGPYTLVVLVHLPSSSPKPPFIEVTARTEHYVVVDDEQAILTFNRMIAPVLLHARCRNCHAVGNGPTQGDDSHPHQPPVTRETKCTDCHKNANESKPPYVPGVPNWHMPPATMPRIFAGRTPGQLCEQIKNPAQNGGLTLLDLTMHPSTDAKLQWAWFPGGGRTTPPGLGWDYLKAGIELWVKNGAACPDAAGHPSRP